MDQQTVEKIGLVTKVDQNMAHVVVARPGECGDKCATCSNHCDAGTMTTVVQNRLGAKIGDRVVLTMKGGEVVRLSFLLYTWPLIALVVGVVVSYTWIIPFLSLDGIFADLLSLSLGLSVMVLSYLLIRRQPGTILRMQAILPPEDFIKL